MMIQTKSGVTVWFDPVVALVIVGIIRAVVFPKTRP